MFFAWDAPLEDAVRAACHRAYRERYGLELGDTAGIRGLVRCMAAAGFASVAVRTHVVERMQPLRDADRDYLRHAIFEGAWGEKVLPFLSPDERARLRRNCDPALARVLPRPRRLSSRSNADRLRRPHRSRDLMEQNRRQATIAS